MTKGEAARRASAGTPLANTLVIGSGPECPHERFCLPGLHETYGLTFKEFLTLDPGGPRTVSALRSGEIDVGVLFTTDCRLATEEFVALDDDRHLQPAENVTPILRRELIDDHDSEIGARLDAVSARLTTGQLAGLNREVESLGVAHAEAARRWLGRQGLLSRRPARPVAGDVIVVGSANFSESRTLAEIYLQALATQGYRTEHAPSIGNRATYIPRLEHGDVGLVPEYLGSLLSYLDPGSAESAEVEVARRAVDTQLGGRGLAALQPAPAEAKNGIVVTAATARRHRLERVSDLARPV